ncbi:MAG: KTSC domain-containing protein [Candidatus Nanopelagicales bacterium]
MGTGGELIPVASDNVSAAGYDAAAQVMTVVFDSGAVYEYAPVESDLWQTFLAAQPHPWSAVGKPGLVDAGESNQRIE